MKQYMGTHKLLRGTHTTPSGRTVKAGETFNPTDKEVEEHGEGRMVRARSYYTVPDVPWLDDEEEDSPGE